jgi:hypothetical protein
MKHSGNQGGRPRKNDRSLTSVRVSFQTRKLLKDWTKIMGFPSMDTTIRYYIPNGIKDEQPVYLSAQEALELTYKSKPIDNAIKSISKELVKKYG